MPARRPLVRLLGAAGFRRLFAVRLATQFGDGVFQAGLAGAVLFNPDRQADPADIATGFAVLLVPYSLVGPFAGVLLDRWSRRQVLAVANALRPLAVLAVAAQVWAGAGGIAFYAAALVVISAGRFVLSALSAALPHVVSDADLVTANSLSTTIGALVTTVGGGAALALRAALGSGNGAYALVGAAAVLPYLLASGAALRFSQNALGPDDAERARRASAWAVAAGLVAGARHVRARPAARNALAVIGLHRLCFGLWTVTTLLLYRNYFAADGLARTGLPGLTQVVVAIAAGGALAALITPVAARQLGSARWCALLLAGAGVVLLAGELPYRTSLALAAALPLGFASQGLKICIDTVVQTQVADEFRGRVFALYDTLFNLALVGAAALTAFALPPTGRAPKTVAAMALVYLLTAAAYAAVNRTRARPVTAAPRTSA
jgi:MFS family permease